MSRVAIDLNSASTEQYAAQILAMLRDNARSKPAGGYFPGCLESILQFEFSPKALGLDVRGGVLRQPGGAVGSYGGDRGPDWLRKKYFAAVNWLRQKGYIVRDHTQSSDQFAEVTQEGQQVTINMETMTLVIARDWNEWHRQYSPLVFHTSTHTAAGPKSGTAFLFREGCLATCAHNCVAPLFVHVNGQEVQALNVHQGALSDVACFDLPEEVELPRGFIPATTIVPEPGAHVAGLGFPSVPLRHPTLGIYAGTVEALPEDYSRKKQFIQVSFQLAGGNSGGPVIDQYGRVVGIVSDRTFEQVEDQRMPSRAFSHVTPIACLSELAVNK